jgi:hypothetical protein
MLEGLCGLFGVGRPLASLVPHQARHLRPVLSGLQ